MVAQFPDILLPDIFNYFELYEILLSAMPVSRTWRNQVLEHRTYWGTLSLVGQESHRGYDRSALPKHMLSGDLFLLLLSRTYARPIDVTVAWLDPAMLDVIVPHLGHIRCLRVVSLVTYWEAVTQALCSAPAPLLETLRLSFHYRLDGSDMELFAAVPRDLFSGQASRLRELHLWDAGIPSAADTPACFSNVAALSFWASRESPLARLPNVFRVCRQLRTLELSGWATLADPEFSRAETWAQSKFEKLALVGPLDPEINVRHVLRLPLPRSARIVFSEFRENGVIILAHALGMRLSVEFPALTPLAERGVLPFDVHFRVFGDTTTAVERIVSMALVTDVPERPDLLAITAFRNPVVCERIVELTISLEDWDVLIGERCVTELRALEMLAIVLSQSTCATAWPTGLSGRLVCPRLARVTLRSGKPSLGQMEIDAAGPAKFAQTNLSGALLPLELDLQEVSVRGSRTAFERVFACIRE